MIDEEIQVETIASQRHGIGVLGGGAVENEPRGVQRLIRQTILIVKAAITGHIL